MLTISQGLLCDKLSPFPTDWYSEYSYEKFKADQLSDSTLISCWLNATNGSTEFVINSENGLLYQTHVR